MNITIKLIDMRFFAREQELENKIEFIEVKRQEKNFNEAVLRAKSKLFFKTVGTFKNYEFIYRGLSIEDM